MNISLYTAASALNANVRFQEAIAENLAASAVPGFKKSELSMAAADAGLDTPSSMNGASPQFALPHAVTTTSFAPGEFRYNGITTNVAIEGRGFLEVQLPDGNLAYTRDGELHLDGQGQLVTKQGFTVMGENGPIQLDSAAGGSLTDSLSIAANGDVAQGVEVRGRLRVPEFNDPSRLIPISGGLFLAQGPGVQEVGNPTSTLRQGWLEQSNASVVTEMANLMTAMRSFETNQRVIQIQDERMAKVISELTPV